MEYIYRDEPILLASHKKTIELTNEGIQFLTSLSDSKVAILSIIGPKNTGKKVFANQIINSKNGFLSIKNSDKSNPEKGLWVWGRPLKAKNHDISIIIIVADGFFEEGVPIEEDKKIFTLCTLISSIIIYNTNNYNVLDFDKLTQNLSQVVVSKDIKINSNYIPELIWLYRDFDNKVKEGQKELEKAFEEGFDRIKSKHLFQNRHFFILPNIMASTPPPKLHQMQKYIFETSKNKVINNIAITGKILYGVLQNYCGDVNVDEKIIITNSLQSVLLSNANEIAGNIISKFKKDLTEEMKEEDNSTILDIYKRFISESVSGYPSNDLDSPKGLPSQIKTFCQSSVGETLYAKDLDKYLIKIILSVNEELVKYSNNFIEEYENLIETVANKEKVEIQEDSLVSFSIEEIFETFIADLKFDMEEILSYPRFCFSDKLLKALDSILFDRIESVGKKLSGNWGNMVLENKRNKELANQQKETIEQLNEELRKTKNSIWKLEGDNEKLKKDLALNNKKLDYLASDGEKRTILQEEIKKISQEKDDKIKKCEEKIEQLKKKILDLNKETIVKSNEITRLTKELDSFKTQGAGNGNFIKNDKDYSSIKIYFESVKNLLTDYKNSLMKLDQEKDSLLKKKAIETSLDQAAEKTEKWLTELKAFREEHSKMINEQYQNALKKAQETINKLNFEVMKLNYELQSEKNQRDEYNKKLEQLKKENQDQINLSLSKDSAIGIQKQHINLLQDNTKELEKKIDGLEIQLNNSIVDCGMQKMENDGLMSIFYDVLSKKKIKPEKDFQQLSKSTKERLKKILIEFNKMK